ncbi:hypothetical protein PWT90_00914 [Aphanocladium album]|nr:hypothetical protein PWT90_00914 [Aphanocladium album]
MASTEKKRLSLPTGVVPSKHFQGLLMTSFALPERPRSRRAKYPKASKKRHVKCDEAKPSCNRCLKWSGVCGGYEPARAKSCPPKSTAATRAGNKSPSARPRTVCEPTSPAIPTLDESVVTPSVNGSEPATPPFLQVYQPLDYFSDHHDGYSSAGSSAGTVNAVMPVMSSPGASFMTNVGEIGILDATFWTDTVPRLVRENLAVRYANMAVHILILSKQPELIIQESPDLGTDHYSLALAHYGLALKQMRHSSEMCGGIRAAVLCSMLFVIFEALNGDREAAEAHLQCGQRMLNELQQLLPNGIAATGAGSLRKELRNLMQYISLQVRIGGVTCWKGEFDTLCAEYLEEFVADEPYDASPGYGTPEGYVSMIWPEDNGIPAINVEEYMF